MKKSLIAKTQELLENLKKTKYSAEKKKIINEIISIVKDFKKKNHQKNHHS